MPPFTVLVTQLLSAAIILRSTRPIRGLVVNLVMCYVLCGVPPLCSAYALVILPIARLPNAPTKASYQ